MSQIIDTSSRAHLLDLFLGLRPDTLSLWGKMEPQQMVEHLIDQVQYTNGKKIPFLEFSEEEAKLAKEKNIYTDLKIPKNVIFGELPDQLIYPDLSSAIKQLMTELDDFDLHFKNPEITAIHGAFGPMNYKEWVIWHSKHFTHHLSQFGLIAMT